MMKPANMDQTMSDPLSTVSYKVFAEQLRSKFATSLNPSETLGLELAEIVDHLTLPEMECFSLFFRGPASPLFPQGARILAHPLLDSMVMYIATDKLAAI